MKKIYNAPQSTCIRLYAENDLANLVLMSGGDAPTLTTEDDILSNKKDNPIWGESKSGMWDNMN